MLVIARVTPAPAVPATRVPEVLPIRVRAAQPTLVPEVPATLGQAAVRTTGPADQSIRGQVGGNTMVPAAQHMMAPAARLTQVLGAHVMQVLAGHAIRALREARIVPASATEAEPGRLIPSISSAPLRRRSVASEKMRAEYQPQAGKGHWLDVRGCFQQFADEVIDQATRDVASWCVTFFCPDTPTSAAGATADATRMFARLAKMTQQATWVGPRRSLLEVTPATSCMLVLLR